MIRIHIDGLSSESETDLAPGPMAEFVAHFLSVGDSLIFRSRYNLIGDITWTRLEDSPDV